MLKEIKKSDYLSFQNYLNSRESETQQDILLQVEKIIKEVREKKDEALYAFSKKFDGVNLSSLVMEEDEMEYLSSSVEDDFIKAMKEAAENIAYFHKQQLQSGYEIQKENGVYLGQRVIPLEKVGVYVPGGRASYPSSVLMNVIPAKIAGVKEIVMVTPPTKEGSVNPYIVAAAKIAGVDKIYKIGGAQAIAALAYGSESIPQVDKIVGPGNAYVACAKRLVFGKVDIDMIAGPSEILVIADEHANPAYVAADLISQAEHDPMAASILLTTDLKLVEKIQEELKKQSAMLPKKAIIEESFKNYGMYMLCESIEECVKYANILAPEHLEILVENPKVYLPLVKNAGSVFLGYYSCESIGDYFGGCNHVLPTNGTARFSSGLNCDAFVKKSTYLYYSKEALLKEGNKIMTIAKHEQLDGHANAVKVRMEYENV